MPSGLSKMDASIDSFMNKLEGMEKLSESNIAAFAHEALKVITPTAKKMLVQNFEKSKVGTLTPSSKYKHTGKIRSAVSQAIIGMNIDGRKIVITAAMPSGVESFVSSSGAKSDFYTVAGSLNFGAVRVPKERRKKQDLSTGKITVEKQDVIGAKAKRTVKKVALGQAVSSRAVNAVEEGRRFKKFNEKKSGKVAKNPRKSVKGFGVSVVSETSSSAKTTGGAVVIKPRPFFEFTETQKAMLSESFVRVFIDLYMDAFGIAA